MTVARYSQPSHVRISHHSITRPEQRPTTRRYRSASVRRLGSPRSHAYRAALPVASRAFVSRFRPRDDERAVRWRAGPTKGRSPLGEFETWADAEAVAPEGASSMKRSTRFKVLWTVWMAGGGLVTWAAVYAITGSVGWAVVGLLASGVVLNAVGQAVVQPMIARSRTRDRQPRSPAAK
jgi:hypothetical protein